MPAEGQTDRQKDRGTNGETDVEFWLSTVGGWLRGLGKVVLPVDLTGGRIYHRERERAGWVKPSTK